MDQVSGVLRRTPRLFVALVCSALLGCGGEESPERTGAWTASTRRDALSLGALFNVADVAPGSTPFSSTPTLMRTLGGVTFFAASHPTMGTELWRTDGTAAGTWIVADIHPGDASSAPSQFVELGGLVYFTAQDAEGGFEQRPDLLHRG